MSTSSHSFGDPSRVSWLLSLTLPHCHRSHRRRNVVRAATTTATVSVVAAPSPPFLKLIVVFLCYCCVAATAVISGVNIVLRCSRSLLSSHCYRPFSPIICLNTIASCRPLRVSSLPSLASPQCYRVVVTSWCVLPPPSPPRRNRQIVLPATSVVAEVSLPSLELIESPSRLPRRSLVHHRASAVVNDQHQFHDQRRGSARRRGRQPAVDVTHQYRMIRRCPRAHYRFHPYIIPYR